jgi:hypothetical protein
MRSPWSVGILMIAMGGIGIAGIGAKPIGPVPYVIAGILVGAGVLMFLRRPFVFWFALAAALVLGVSGALAWAGKPQLALPVPPTLSIVIALYLCLRSLIARPHLQPRKTEPSEDA